MNITNLTYNVEDSEHSYVSLASTLIPCTILLNYYLNNEKEYIIDEMLDAYSYDFDVNCDAYEIFSGLETSIASKYLESTMVEAGIGLPIIHDKYSYCHGRSTLSTTSNNIAIYFNGDTQLDKLLISELNKYYKNVIILNTNCPIISFDKYAFLINEYTLLIKCMYLTKYIAEQKNKDLSGVIYNPIVKKLYKYNGNL
jgi:hypothetical protein